MAAIIIIGPASCIFAHTYIHGHLYKKQPHSKLQRNSRSFHSLEWYLLSWLIPPTLEAGALSAVSTTTFYPQLLATAAVLIYGNSPLGDYLDWPVKLLFLVRLRFLVALGGALSQHVRALYLCPEFHLEPFASPYSL